MTTTGRRGAAALALQAMAATLALVAAAPAQAQTGADQPARWTRNIGFEIGPVFLMRTHGGDRAITQTNGNPLDPGERTFNWSDVGGTGIRGGIEGTLSYRFDQRQSAWLRGFIVGEHGDTLTRQTDPAGGGVNSGTSMAYAEIPGTNTDRATNTVNTDNSEAIFGFQASTRSALGSIEANYGYLAWQRGRYQIRAFGGPRYLQFRDRLSAIAFDSANDFPGMGTDTDIDRVGITVLNHLVGGQLGVDAVVPLTASLSLQGRVAGGLYANLVRRHRSFSSDDAPTNGINDRLSGTRFAQSVEGSVAVVWQFHPGWSASVGYTALWLNNVSVAQRHFESAANGNDRDLRANADVLYQGFRLAIGAAF